MSLMADDKSSILDLSARCNHTFDSERWDDWLECYASDAVYDAPALNRRLVGHEALRALTLRPPVPIRTLLTTHVIDVDDDSATMIAFFSVLRLDDPPQTIAVGRYEDRLAKVDALWSITQRRVVVYWKKYETGWA